MPEPNSAGAPEAKSHGMPTASVAPPVLPPMTRACFHPTSGCSADKNWPTAIPHAPAMKTAKRASRTAPRPLLPTASVIARAASRPSEVPKTSWLR